MGGAPAVLSRRRAAALLALLAALVAYGAGAGRLPDVSNAWDVAFVAVVLLPVTTAAIWLVLPLARARGVALVGLALVGLAAVLDLAGAGSAFNVSKLLALAVLGFAFLELFQELSWVVAVALVIPWVDAISVWRGPTKVVVTKHVSLFDRISIAFRVPGESIGANLGPPDILFFALFLATAQRFRLRTGWTFAAMATLLGVTLVITSTVDVAGLPALPAISLGFLLPNADLLLARWRGRRSSRAGAG